MVTSRGGSDRTEQEETDLDELLNSLGVDRVPDWQATEVAGGDEGASGPDDDSLEWLWRPSTVMGICLGLAVLAGAVSFVYARGSDDGDGTAATEAAAGPETTAEPPTAAADDDQASTDLSDAADGVRATLERLGFSDLYVDMTDSAVTVSGTVATDQDVSTIRNALLAEVDPSMIDMSELTADGLGAGRAAPPAPGGQQGFPPPPPPGGPPPGAPPRGFVPPTPEQMEDLQRELDRVFTETPMVFDPGSSRLTELQLEVLDSVVIGLLEAHPGVPVRVVGYTDSSGNTYDNTLLSLERANAVTDYLVARGVPRFIVRPEGRADDNASGEAGADRRVELEVIQPR